jgi:hypothetical protein
MTSDVPLGTDCTGEGPARLCGSPLEWREIETATVAPKKDDDDESQIIRKGNNRPDQRDDQRDDHRLPVRGGVELWPGVMCHLQSVVQIPSLPI